MLVAEVAVARLAAQVAAAMVLTTHRALLRLWQELLTQGAGVAVAAIQAPLARLAVRALSLFVTQIHMQQPRLPQGHPQLLCLAVTVYTNGQAQGVSHSDGTLCTT
jgi:hypothetical protein